METLYFTWACGALSRLTTSCLTCLTCLTSLFITPTRLNMSDVQHIYEAH